VSVMGRRSLPLKGLAGSGRGGRPYSEELGVGRGTTLPRKQEISKKIGKQ